MICFSLIALQVCTRVWRVIPVYSWHWSASRWADEFLTRSLCKYFLYALEFFARISVLAGFYSRKTSHCSPLFCETNEKHNIRDNAFTTMTMEILRMLCALKLEKYTVLLFCISMTYMTDRTLRTHTEMGL